MVGMHSEDLGKALKTTVVFTLFTALHVVKEKPLALKARAAGKNLGAAKASAQQRADRSLRSLSQDIDVPMSKPGVLDTVTRLQRQI